MEVKKDLERSVSEKSSLPPSFSLKVFIGEEFQNYISFRITRFQITFHYKLFIMEHLPFILSSIFF